MDEQLLGAAAMGARGAVGSTYNYSGKVAGAVLAAVARGDLAAARALQRGPQVLVNLLLAPSRYGPAGCNVNKAIMELRMRARAGLRSPAALAAARAAGARTVFAMGARAPVPAVTAEGLALLEADLDAIGFFSEAWM
jgi:dihydrodipicolinate synthase/N-acetylneuraminate lyase